MPENKVEPLDDGAKGNAGQAKTDEVRVGGRRGVLAAGNVLLALLVDKVLDGDSNEQRDWKMVSDLSRRCKNVVKLTLEVQLGALVEQTKTISTGAGADQVGQSTAEHARVDIGGVTGVGGLVAAGELSLVTALGLSLLDCQVLRNGELDIGVTLVANAVAVTNTTGGGTDGRKGSNGGSEAKNSSERELHCVGLGLNERDSEFWRLKEKTVLQKRRLKRVMRDGEKNIWGDE